MNAVVVGYGSIGARHARILESLSNRVGVVTSREIARNDTFSTISDAIETLSPTYVVIANMTAQHHRALTELADAGFTGRVLVEKPLFDGLSAIPENRFERLWVGYNLRFHPVLQRLKTLVAADSVISVQAYAGQYLPDWRPAVDYRSCYSSSRANGGGVLRDLSHEIDYIQWLFGCWCELTAIGGHYSSLDIDSDDTFGLLMRTEKANLVSIQLNYLDRPGRRDIVVVTDRATYHADLRGSILRRESGEERFTVDADMTYREQHRDALSSGDSVCTSNEAVGTLEVIDAAERSAASREWISR